MDNKIRINLPKVELQKHNWAHRYENSGLKKLIFNRHGPCARHCCKGLCIYYVTLILTNIYTSIIIPFWTSIQSSEGSHSCLRSLTNKWQSKGFTFNAPLSMSPHSLATHWWGNLMLIQGSWNLPPDPRKRRAFSGASSLNWRWKREGRVGC